MFQDTSNHGRLRARDRWLLAIGATAVAVLLAIAVCLRPSPDGLGTHQQLGLYPCSFRVLFDRPCPTCGMTTSWACLMRGRVADAGRANLGGLLLGMLGLAGSPWMLLSALRGRWVGIRPNGDAAAWMLSAIALITLVQWAVRLMNG
jgi:hypothetical protein